MRHSDGQRHLRPHHRRARVERDDLRGVSVQGVHAGMKSKWQRMMVGVNRRRVLDDRRNPIVWNKRKWYWPHRYLPPTWSLFRAEHGELALRRMRAPGWIAEMQWVRRLR